MKARTRRKLKKSEFGLPGERKYPMPDKAHAVNAKARAKQQRKQGKLSKSAYEKVVANANKVIKRSKRKSKTDGAKQKLVPSTGVEAFEFRATILLQLPFAERVLRQARSLRRFRRKPLDESSLRPVGWSSTEHGVLAAAEDASRRRQRSPATKWQGASASGQLVVRPR